MEETTKKLAELEEKINKIYISVEKTRKYIMWTVIISILIVVLPAILLAFVLPSFISSFTGNIQNIGL